MHSELVQEISFAKCCVLLNVKTRIMHDKMSIIVLTVRVQGISAVPIESCSVTFLGSHFNLTPFT